MFTLIAQVLVNNIDNIARVWVDELRRTERTESHNHMLTAEIVNGLKSMLSSVAEAIQAQEAPDNETIPMPLVVARQVDDPAAAASVSTTGALARQLRASTSTTRPLQGPLALAKQSATTHGRLRAHQGFEIHEVVFEYVKLRQIIWDTLRQKMYKQDERHPSTSLYA